MKTQVVPKRILFVMPKLDRGGAERVVLNLLKHIDRKRFCLHLALIAKAGDWSDQIPEHVVIHNLSAGRVRRGMISLLKLIIKLSPHTVFSTGKEVNLAVCLIKTFFLPKMYLVIREANALSVDLAGTLKMPIHWKILYRLFYPRADKVICLSNDLLKHMRKSFSIPGHKLVCLYNPLDIDTIQKKAAAAPNPFFGRKDGPHIVAAGRLINEKGFDLLISCFPKLLEQKKSAQLWILGDGPQESKFRKLRKSLGLEDCVHFAGFQSNIYTWLKYADLFILSSRSEGLPNVLLEAMACGCPVAVRKHPGGTHEVMELTNQLERLSTQIDWKAHWFRHDSGQVIDKLKKYYGIKTVTALYASIFNGRHHFKGLD